MRAKTVMLALILVSSAFVAGVDNLAAGVNEEAISLPAGSVPPVGSTFTFHVKTSGDKTATVPAWQEPGEHDEVHTYAGTVKGVKGKTKDGTIEGSEPHDCIEWVVTRPDKPDFYANFYYAMEDNAMHFYLEEESGGGIHYYVDPLKIISFPLRVGDKHSSNSFFYANVPNTYQPMVRTYESSGVKKDTVKANASVDKKENISVGDETFECYKISILFETHSGSFITASTTTLKMEKWWSPELGYFVKEHVTILVDAFINCEGAFDRELVSYNIAG